MSTELITAEQAITALREVVAGSEEFVYKAPAGSLACVYVCGDKPHCLVAQALHRLGVPISTMAGWDAFGHATGIGRTGRDTCDPQAVAVLAAAQLKQDCGRAWGEALAAAEKAYQVTLLG